MHYMLVKKDCSLLKINVISREGYDNIIITAIIIK